MEKQLAQDYMEGGAEPGFESESASRARRWPACWVPGTGPRGCQTEHGGRDPHHRYRPLSPFWPILCLFPGRQPSKMGAVGPGVRTESQHFPTRVSCRQGPCAIAEAAGCASRQPPGRRSPAVAPPPTISLRQLKGPPFLGMEVR